MSYFKTSSWILGSVISSVGLIFTNKFIMGPSINFVYVFALTAIHFLVNAIIMEIMAFSGFFCRNRLPWSSSLEMSIACTLSVGLMNLSLKQNSVGFYQLCKLLGVPWLVIVQTIWYKMHTSLAVKFSLAMIFLGMMLATVTDVHVNLYGTFVGLSAVVVSTQFQIWQGVKQHKYKLNAMQINHAQALPTFCVCSTLALLLEFNSFYKPNNILSHKWTSIHIVWILASAILAGCVNLCSYGLIGNTSTLTFQVVGHVKTILVLVGGYLFIQEQDRAKIQYSNLMGMVICLGGAILYGCVRHSEIIDNGLFQRVDHVKTMIEWFWRRSKTTTNQYYDENPLILNISPQNSPQK